ncbi:MAG: efflux transporter periplasmic adaptor subunit [Gammaproteobacteria bacterium]|jgi:multidrug efflux system membrane fusion protein|nr:efflux transporter periplasmic adaptor subunit [Gammaproteobacteria bacterium]
MKTRQIACNGGFMTLMALLAACHGKHEPSSDIRPVRTAVVGTGVYGDNLTYTGEVRARHESDLGFQVAGKLIARPAEVGAHVTVGTVLAQLEPADEKVALDSAQSAVSATQAELARALSEEASYRHLLERGLTTRTTYVEQQTATKTARSRLEQAQASFDLRRRQLNYTTLRADEAGVITRVSADVGTVLAQGQAVVTLAQPSELDVVFDVADTQVDAVRSAKTVAAALLSARDKPLVASVREVSPSADPVTRTYRVKCTLPGQPPGWHLGLNTIVTLEAGHTTTSVRIPSTALYEKDRKSAVWIVKDDQTIALRPIVVARYDTDSVEVSSGLRSGERIVTAGVHKLLAGQKVRLLSDSGK